MIFTMDEVRRLQTLRHFQTYSNAQLREAADPSEVIRFDMVSRLRRAMPLAANIVERDVIIRPTAWAGNDQVRFEAFWEPPICPARVALIGGIPSQPRGSSEIHEIRDLLAGIVVESASGVRVHYAACGWNNDEGHWVMSQGGRLS